MAISTNAAIENGYYGRKKYDSENKEYKFTPLGKAVILKEILANIEDGEVYWRLAFTFFDDEKIITIPRKDAVEGSILTSLFGKGSDVPKAHNDIIVDTLRVQEELMEINREYPQRVYTKLGWIELPAYNEDGEPVSKFYYRSHKLIGGQAAQYFGDYRVEPKGTFEAWRDMVVNEVIGNTALELVLIASLSAVVNGLISPHTTGESPIVHLNSGSSGGKTTALMVATSAYGEPFDGEHSFLSNGEIIKQRSLYSSWGATENATITQCAGNRGAVVILNELGKFVGSSDMTRICYDLSEGTDKTRLNGQMKATTSEGFNTTIISAGEISLLGRCKNKLEGLQNRVLELDCKLTNDAEHSRRLKRICRANNGWAAPILAQYILDNGGLDFVLDQYNSWCDTLPSMLPSNPSTARFIEKFAALFLTTASLAYNALGIQFDIPGLVTFFVEHEEQHGKERNTSAESYDVIIEACRANRSSFYYPAYLDPVGKILGKISFPNELLSDGRIVAEKYAVRKFFVEEILAKNGFPNVKTCAKEWKAMGVLDYEKGRNTRSQKIERLAKEPEDVYVFRVFETKGDDKNGNADNAEPA